MQLSNTAASLESLGVRLDQPPAPWTDPPALEVRSARQLSPEQVELIVELYKAGAPLADIVTKVGCDRSTIYDRLQASGVDRKRYIPPTEREIQMAVAAYESGASLSAVGGQLGVHQRTARDHLVRAGVEIRKRRGR